MSAIADMGSEGVKVWSFPMNIMQKTTKGISKVRKVFGFTVIETDENGYREKHIQLMQKVVFQA